MRNNFGMDIRIAILLLALPLLAACEPSHSRLTTGANSAAANPAALEAFQNTMYSFGQTQGCVKCHGANVNPTWMSPDLALAYSLAQPRVDFNNPNASTFTSYVANNHCLDPVCANPANVSVVQGLLAQWANVELIVASGGSPVDGGSTLANPTYVTASMPIPSPLPNLTAAQPAVIRFELSKLNPPVPALNGAVLEISIRSYNAMNSQYKISSPRVAGTSVPVKFTGLHVYVLPAAGTGLGTEDIYQGDLWSSVSATAAPYALTLPLPAGPLTAVPLSPTSLGVQAQSDSDVITIGFARIN